MRRTEGLLAALDGLVYIAGMPVLDSITDKTVIAENTLTFIVEAVNAVTGVVYGATVCLQGASFDAAYPNFNWTPGKEQGGVIP